MEDFLEILRKAAGLQSKFVTFKQNIDEWRSDSDLIEKIIASKDYLQSNLEGLDYIDKIILTGSYKKYTMLKPPDGDLDLFAILKDYSTSTQPQSILNRIKEDLKDTYPNSDIRQDRPCIVIDFDHCKIEITPAIPYVGGIFGYYIPKNDEGWQISNPIASEDTLSKKNAELKYYLIPLIKMMKVCKKFNSISEQSFALETKAVNGLYNISDYRDGVQKLLRVYGWSDKTPDYYTRVESMSSDDFVRYAREKLFGDQFPE